MCASRLLGLSCVTCQQFSTVSVVLSPPFSRCLALEGLSRSEVVSVAWDPHPWDPIEGGSRSVVAPACVVSRPCGMSTVRGGFACGPSTLWNAEVAVLSVFRSVGGDANFGVPGGGLGGRAVTVGVRLPCKFRVCTTVGCSCCCVACVASMVARCVRAVVARLAVDSLVVVFPYGGGLQASRGAVLLVIFDAFECVCIPKAERACVWCGLHRCRVSALLLELSRCSVCRVASLVERCDTCPCLLSAWLRCIAWLPYVLGLRYAVVLAGAFWWVFPERCLGGSSGGSPRTILCCFCSSACCSVLFDDPCCLVIGLCIPVKVLPRIVLCHFWQRTALGTFGGGIVGQGVVPSTVCLAVEMARLPCYSFPSFSTALVGLHMSPWSGGLLLAPCVLSQMVV
ncbi:hypothetical protein Taro_014229 [Colocasia esculenta]|uniref:Uncharacterized protein n=1 Tax=Colocasia esculenta TaxID=4460 RepID=A0A843UIG2_COLES|nr:hypothetical protein [Colocasia esculenta]